MRVLVTLCLLGLTASLTAQSTYFNAEYWISLRYPREYELTEGKDARGLGYLGPISMEFVAPGGIRVVTVEPPAHSYPGTDFENAFFTVSVNQYLTQDECGRFPDSLSRMSRAAGEEQIGGIEFRALRQGEGGLGHAWGGTYYHGFSKGLCYEIGYGMATNPGALPDVRQVDVEAVFSILQGILKSVSLRVPESAAPRSNLPSIKEFSLTPLPPGPPPSRYRVSWEVQGAQASQVRLTVACFGGENSRVLKLTDSGTEGSVFPCGVLERAGSDKGSLTLEFRNMSGGEVSETIRLFVAGQPSLSETETISLPPLPVVISLEMDGNFYVLYTGRPGKYTQTRADDRDIPRRSLKEIPIVAGHLVDIGGVGFLPDDTLWVGSRSMPVRSLDGRTITFTVPESLPQGTYSLILESKHGRSDAVTVQVMK